MLDQFERQKLVQSRLKVLEWHSVLLWYDTVTETRPYGCPAGSSISFDTLAPPLVPPELTCVVADVDGVHTADRVRLKSMVPMLQVLA